MEQSSKKLFTYFSKTKVVCDQANDLLESDILRLPLRYGLKDFIVYSDVREFQSERIRDLARTFGGEIGKGSVCTPEHR